MFQFVFTVEDSEVPLLPAKEGRGAPGDVRVNPLDVRRIMKELDPH